MAMVPNGVETLPKMSTC